jgi:O-antigen ligase
LRAQAAVVLVGLSPAVVVPHALNRFVFGKLAFIAAGIALAFLAPVAGRLRRHVTIALLAAVAVALLAATVSDHPVVSLLGRSPRFEGALVIFVYVGAFAAAARVLGDGRRQTAVSRPLLHAMSVAAALIALIAVLEAFGLRPLTSNVSRPGSLLGNASDEGAVGVLMFGPLALSAVALRRWTWAAGAGAAALTVILSASRSALIALLVELVVWAVIAGSRRIRAGVLVVAVAITGIAFAVPATRDRITGSSQLAHHTVTGRELLWRETLHLDAHHLLLGVGPSNYRTAITAEHDREWQQRVGPDNPPDSPHDVFLQVLSDGGIPGLLAALAVVLLMLGPGVRAMRRSLPEPEQMALGSGVLIAVVGYGGTLAVGITSPGPTALAAFLAGLLAAEPATVDERAARKARDVTVAAVAMGLTVVFVLAGIAEVALRSAILDVGDRDIAGADHQFHVARALRAWDLDLPDVAAHAFLTEAIATDTQSSAVTGQEWLTRVPGALRDDEQVRLDTAQADELFGRLPQARTLLSAVLIDDPDNPAVLLRRGIVEAEQHDDPAAIRDFRQVSEIDVHSPEPWQDLAVVYDHEHRPRAAAAARARARQRGG